MGDISLPRSEEFYRIQFMMPPSLVDGRESPETVYRCNRVAGDELERHLSAAKTLGWRVERIEHCIVEVTVVDVTQVFIQRDPEADWCSDPDTCERADHK